MKQGIAIGAAALVIVALAAAVVAMPKSQKTAASPATPSPTPRSVSAQAVADVAAGRATLIDVRSASEFAAGHAKGAINFDVVNIQAGQLPDVSKAAKIYLYCHSGRRAGIALPILQQAGYADVTNIKSLQSWLDAGGPRA